ncbi:probable 4-coumarate--CoA ligase 3 [Trichoplusia ni]|uniref:Luciferin 4-monooxygenase n=1 Tax=Trichoplusia ni TaxID=7111 RepID=A0A7E5VQ01_TRINI|nr:probable 4-coumarate--CoA ligase 3 [Trichoplusia ni]XP_026730406.1 probable 4-coumarate--CoA ligase 3 [Trichoplusia ni]
MTAKSIISNTAQKLLAFRFIPLTSSRELSAWTPDKIVKSPHRDVDIPNRTVPEQIWENMERWVDRTAIECAITKQSYTYYQMYKYSRNFAAKLRTLLKIQDGDVICIMMPNSPDFAVAAIGALEAGAEVTTVNPIYTPHEVHRQITLSDPKVLFGVPETIPVLKEALALAKKDLPVICIKGVDGVLPPETISFQEFALADNVDHSILKEVRRQSEDVAFLPYSSGTTGLPKGVELVHRNIVVNFLQQNVDTLRHYDETTKTSQDTVLAVLPFYHIYGLSIILLHKLSVGLKVVTLPKFQPNTFIDALKEHKTNVLCAAPPLILFLGSHPVITNEHLASIKTITSGSAPLPRVDVVRVLDKVKHKLNFLQVYGLTETSPLATAMLPGSENYASAGYAISNTELRIVDSDLKPLGPKEVGELLIRGPQVMKGYRNNPEATKKCMTEDGWFQTGDLASIDIDGTVTIADRLKELIKVKGFQVPPAELENVLKEHPDVLDAAVIGVPDVRMGEVPKAFIVLRDGKRADAHSITNFVSKRVAEYKRIKEVRFLNELPKNPSGKILRRVLKEL